jgi:threonine/homoserine/homoserine lactone efflux protein
MEPKVGRVVLASIAVFCIAAALGAGSNLLYVASGSSLWFKGVLAGGVAVLGWYGLWARRCWNEKRPSTPQSKLQEMEERWKTETERKTPGIVTSKEQAPPSSKERSE